MLGSFYGLLDLRSLLLSALEPVKKKILSLFLLRVIFVGAVAKYLMVTLRALRFL